MNRVQKKTELLAPAGNFEKLETAIRYGADAIYLAGKDFSLRNFSGNFTPEEMQQAIALAHAHGVRVYVACNIYARNDEQEAIGDYLRRLGDIGPDALIIADPGIFAQARALVPDIPVHISTQSNTTNYMTARFWKDLGATRLNMARELSLEEIRGIADHCDIEIEAFVHGAMCISYSGRCLLSSFMAKRDSNRGLCCHPCRFKYAVVEELRPGRYYPLMEDDRGSYIFNSKDLCMIGHIPHMIRAGIGSLKIEGRMKGINYVASVIKVYREAIDAFYENPDTWAVRPAWIEELSRVDHRGYCTGFYRGDPDQITPGYERYDYTNTTAEAVFAGKITDRIAPDTFRVAVRNKLCTGDTVEILSPGRPLQQTNIREITDDNGAILPLVQPNSTALLTLNADAAPLDMIRKLNF
ncbi:peptidase U32 [Desulfonema ishimotonii]|uniref:Peptidase U32 n=1 Tax=Desulfonema ishimotonii TaxID=45657 RepID=A0A401G490_9BACT|nr:U32 family peptidase [Desulfonema ishimotonii]GBC64040.1 peptidase U32 [Desulfonema ishimotonii]